jgi:hypothetical protein
MDERGRYRIPEIPLPAGPLLGRGEQIDPFMRVEDRDGASTSIRLPDQHALIAVGGERASAWARVIVSGLIHARVDLVIITRDAASPLVDAVRGDLTAAGRVLSLVQRPDEATRRLSVGQVIHATMDRPQVALVEGVCRARRTGDWTTPLWVVIAGTSQLGESTAAIRHLMGDAAELGLNLVSISRSSADALAVFPMRTTPKTQSRLVEKQVGEAWDRTSRSMAPVVKTMRESVPLPLGPVDPTMLIQGPDATDADIERVCALAEMPLTADDVRGLRPEAAMIVSNRNAYVMVAR